MSRARFLQLWEGIRDGTLLERWPKGKEPETKQEHTEARQIRAVMMLFREHRKNFDLLLESDDWTEFEVIVGPGGLLRARARRK